MTHAHGILCVLNPTFGMPRYRMKLRHTRRIIDAIHNGELGRAEYSQTPIFNLHIPKVMNFPKIKPRSYSRVFCYEGIFA